MNNTQTKPIPNYAFLPHFKVITIDETEAWSDAIVQKAGKLFGVYLYNCNRSVNLAELAPSFEIHFLYTVTQNDVDESTYEDILEGEGILGPDIIYIHCNQMKGGKSMVFDYGPTEQSEYIDIFEEVIDSLPDDTDFEWDDINLEEIVYQSLLEEIIEYSHCNHPY